MDNYYLREIVSEIAPLLDGRRLTRAALHGRAEAPLLRLEFGGPRAAVVARLSATDPGLYLASDASDRNSKVPAHGKPELHSSSSAQPLILQIRSKLVGAGVTGIYKDDYDRVVRIAFRPRVWSEARFEASSADFTLILILTGRSVNVVLVGQSGLIEAAFKEAGPIQIGGMPPPPRPVAFDPDLALSSANPDLTEDQIIKSYFGRSSLFTKLYEKEFLARANSQTPSLAFQSLLEDLFKNNRTPIIYAPVPLDHVATSPSSRTAELILSCIELTSAASSLRYDFASFSEGAEVYSQTLAAATALRARFARLTGALETRLKKLQAALGSIQSDLERFGEPERLKRFGDLLLANLTTARVKNGIARVKDYYESGEPEIEIQIGEDQTLQQAAAVYYERYQKARRAVKTLVPRAKEISGQIARNEELLNRLRQNSDVQSIEEVESRSGVGSRGTGKDQGSAARGRGSRVRARIAEIGRRFLSSDGLEIVVGRNDSENDAITFRVAGSVDIWLHAADYPGSHVVIRNPTRQAVPQRSIIEAARIAAFYSQARRQGKAAVNYTQKKFVTKPPRAKPGLVRLSSYKTLLVEPGVPAGLDRESQKP
jgi:predicted ribosome quality control (RQC) complex YloA/Tae2 family protein